MLLFPYKTNTLFFTALLLRVKFEQPVSLLTKNTSVSIFPFHASLLNYLMLQVFAVSPLSYSTRDNFVTEIIMKSNPEIFFKINYFTVVCVFFLLYTLI